MGLFEFLRKGYEEDYDLENLEDLVYDDEQIELTDESDDEITFTNTLQDSKDKTEQLDMSKLFEGLGIDEKFEEKNDFNGLDENTKRRQKEVSDEEARYDHLLNSVQAQDLIKTVDKLNSQESSKNDEKVKKVSEKSVAKDIINDNHDKINIVLPDITRKPKKLDRVNTEGFKAYDIEKYVKEQCDIMEEASNYIENAKAEYESVSDYFNDIQIIEEAPEDIREQIRMSAEMVDNLAVDRRIFKSTENKLSNNAYRRMEMYENELPKGIKFLRRQEEYYEAVSRDMRMLDGERMSHRIESKELVRRQLKIRKYSIAAIVFLGFIFVLFLIMSAASPENDNLGMFITVSILAGVMALGLLAMLKTTERKVYVTEVKLNKATSMLNKMKIKYVNAANVLDYEYNKYGVKSSYELEKKYQMYVEMKMEQQKLMEMTSNLNSAEVQLQERLKKLGLYDPHIWIGQARALYNPKEMVEVRHSLTVRRQKLRNQIEYNEGRIQEAKENIKGITKSNPEYTNEALKVIEMYEKKHVL